jgi:hypothetical protein
MRERQEWRKRSYHVTVAHPGKALRGVATDKGFVAHQRIDERYDQLATIDFDRDGRDELVLIGDSGITIYSSTRSGPLALTEIARVQAGHAPRRAFTRDLDTDGLTDLVLVNGDRPTWSGDTLINSNHASVTVLMGRACSLATSTAAPVGNTSI